jgi:hypothetical protein
VFHPGKAVGQRVQHISYKQNRQLPITESGPVAMGSEDTVDHLLNLSRNEMMSGIVSTLSIFVAIINLQVMGFMMTMT